VNRFC